MGSKSDFVPDSFIKALQRGNLGFRAWTERQQWHMAKLIWEEGLKRREHRRREGWITIGHKELERGFGRGGFAAMNAALAVFDVSENWHYRDGRSRKQNGTKGLQAHAVGHGAQRAISQAKKKAITRLIYLDSKDEFHALKSVPNPIAAKEDDDALGVTATAWRQAKPFNKVPVDLVLMRGLYEHLTRMLKREPKPERHFLAGRGQGHCSAG